MAEKKTASKAAKARGAASTASAVPAESRPPLHDLLRDPLITVRDGGDRSKRSLAEVMALLGASRIDAFPALQAFQQHAWHAFLVQLAAMALHRGGESSPKLSAARWEDLLIKMTAGEREPWCLVVDDLSKPAFMQPPVPEGTLAEFKNAADRPDLIDILVLSKNHDVKMGRMNRPEPEHWAFALVSLQTMQGVLGAGKYGIARMNGGYGSRPGVGLSPRTQPGWRFACDVQRLLAGRGVVLAQHDGYTQDGGRGLLWLEPWDGSEGASVAAFDGIDPYFVEVCRRVRLARGTSGGTLQAWTRATEASRLASKELHGVTGDPWTPVNVAENTCFTASESGFGYQVVQRLLSDAVRPGIALKPGKNDGDSILVAEVMVRGQGQTNGYHHRAIAVPARAVHRLAQEVERKALAAVAQERVEAAATVRTRVLLPAVLALLQGDPPKLQFKDDRPRPWLGAFEDAVDVRFFERLWPDLDRPPAEARHDWERLLLDLARIQLDRAIESAPTPVARRYRAVAGGERMFDACQRKHFRHLFDQPQGERA
jgi:CRISPR system Cascade subunit CasA